MSTEMQETYEDMFEADKLKIQEYLVAGWKKMETHFLVESTV